MTSTPRPPASAGLGVLALGRHLSPEARKKPDQTKWPGSRQKGYDMESNPPDIEVGGVFTVTIRRAFDVTATDEEVVVHTAHAAFVLPAVVAEEVTREWLAHRRLAVIR